MKTNAFSELLAKGVSEFFKNILTIIGLILSFVSLKVFGKDILESFIISLVLIFISFIIYILIKYGSKLYRDRTEEIAKANKIREENVILLPKDICISDIYPYTIENCKIIRTLELNSETFKFDSISRQSYIIKGGYDEISFIEGNINIGASLSHKISTFEVTLDKEYSKRHNGKIELERIQDSEISQRYRIYFYPPLKKDEIVEYQIIMERKNCVYISSEFIERDRLKGIIRNDMTYEYSSRHMPIPIKKYHYELKFPNAYAGIREVRALVKKKNIEVKKISKYLKKDFKHTWDDGEKTLLIRTENPLVGFSYQILWMPPRLEELVKSGFISKEDEQKIRESFKK